VIEPGRWSWSCADVGGRIAKGHPRSSGRRRYATLALQRHTEGIDLRDDAADLDRKVASPELTLPAQLVRSLVGETSVEPVAFGAGTYVRHAACRPVSRTT